VVPLAGGRLLKCPVWLVNSPVVVQHLAATDLLPHSVHARPTPTDPSNRSAGRRPGHRSFKFVNPGLIFAVPGKQQPTDAPKPRPLSRSHAGKRHAPTFTSTSPRSRLFFLLATENPIEQSCTTPPRPKPNFNRSRCNVHWLPHGRGVGCSCAALPVRLGRQPSWAAPMVRQLQQRQGSLSPRVDG
jgi:hypothetical protein